VGQVVGLLMQFENAKTALAGLEQTMMTPGERSEESSFVHRPDIRGEIEFRNVSFTYPGHTQEVLRNVSFRIKPGERVVVLGSGWFWQDDLA
jgi:ATP-binding cassette subfamily C protein LapB